MKANARADTGLGYEHVRLTAQQRFCPLCDRSFADAEAVLRCQVCGVLHHPGCWVKNDGCSTESDHTRQPAAEAYHLQRPFTAASAAESQRIVRRSSQSAGASARFAGEHAADPGERETIPAPAAYPERRHAPAPYAVPDRPPVAPRRYQPPAAEAPLPRKPLPKLYRSNPFLAYWYVPVAVVLFAGVAAAVIFAADALLGGDDGPAPAATVAGGTATPQAVTPLATGLASAGAPPVVSQTTQATQPARTGKFRAGDAVIVSGTGDCLNVRTAPGRDNPAVVCLPDAAEVTVREGPQTAGDLLWWKVSTPQGDGWAAEDYLAKKP